MSIQYRTAGLTTTFFSPRNANPKDSRNGSVAVRFGNQKGTPHPIASQPYHL